MKTTACRGCGEPIHFVKSEKTGKFIPCDADLLDWTECDVGDSLVDPGSGEIHRLKGGNEDQGLVGYVPHWATCAKADDFRRKI